MPVYQIHNIIACILGTLSLLYMIAVYRRDLMMLQQNSYRNDRYTRWLNNSGETTRFNRILGCIALFLLLVRHLPFGVSGIIASLIIAGCYISLLTARYKKPLVMTPRAWRILLTALIISILVDGTVWCLTHNNVTTCATLLLLVVASPFVILMSNWLLKPVEKFINRRYLNDAARILASMPQLKIIGITGSYGKTSTKHYLHRILSEQYDTLMTPGSYNTTMGVVRTIREYMKPYNEVFIVEMGAKQPGDIKEICDLVHPMAGIVTAVGEQHLESFKSIERVQQTKFELIDALPDGALAVLNNDFPYVASRETTGRDVCRYTVNDIPGSQVTVTGISYSPQGTTFTVNMPGEEPLPIETRLVGECNISNLTAAIIVAVKLGVPRHKIQYAAGKIEQVEHRLNVKRTPSGITIIDDAFNSNPDGSRMAVDVLSRFTGGKRIIITPGMIELGDKQDHYNTLLGQHISNNVDIAIIVGQYNRDSLLAGLAQGSIDRSAVHAVDTFDDAQRLAMTLATAGDTILYENDLPDTFK